MTTDDLLRPTIDNDLPARAQPWRLNPQFWVFFLGGALAGGTIAILNAGRLGLSRKTQWLMAALTAVTLGVLIVLWVQRPPAADFGSFLRGARDLRMYARIAAVLLFLVLREMQRAADAHHRTFAGDAYASLWRPGAIAVFVLGAVQPLTLAAIGWFAP